MINNLCEQQDQQLPPDQQPASKFQAPLQTIYEKKARKRSHISGTSSELSAQGASTNLAFVEDEKELGYLEDDEDGDEEDGDDKIEKNSDKEAGKIGRSNMKGQANLDQMITRL